MKTRLLILGLLAVSLSWSSCDKEEDTIALIRIVDFSEYYEQGQAGFAVLNIEATSDTSIVEGIIKIDPETVNQETLILQ